MQKNKIKSQLLSLAYYLPQFHEIAENNQWWGEGFTEWQHLREAEQYSPLQQIRKPIAPFGEYHLLNPQVMEWQNTIAKQYGINGFMVFDYWFGAGKTLLEQPMQIVLNQQINFDYCLCWANHTWYNKRKDILLIQQQYLGVADYTAYFYRLLPHFKSKHYIYIDNKPIFAIFNPKDIPDLELFTKLFRDLAAKEGLGDLYIIAENTDNSSPHAHLFDRYTRSADVFQRRAYNNLWSYAKEKLTRKFKAKNLGPFYYNYADMVNYHSKQSFDSKRIPTVFTGWDTTPRHKRRGTVYTGFNVASFSAHLQQVQQLLTQNQSEQAIVIIKSWNEWAEGNLLEPDHIFGDGLLQVYQQFVSQADVAILQVK
jgi:Glycosyltransferase WbsX